MKKQLTELRLSIEHTNEAIEYWLNNYLLKHPESVEGVEWVAKDNQFRVTLKEQEPSEPEGNPDKQHP